MKHVPTLAALLIAGLCLLGCHRADSSPRPQKSVPGSARAERAFIDDLQREVLVPQPVERIVSLAPSCTETLFAVGAGDRVVGVTSFSNYPPEALAVAQVGGLTRETVSLEKIVQLRPDVVFSAGTLQYDLLEDLTALGIVVIAFEPRDVDGIVANLRLAGEITGNARRAAEVMDQLEREIAEIARRVEDLADEDRPAVFYEVWNRPLRTASAASYLGQLVTLAGGRNIFAEFSEPYPLVSEEAVVQRNPDVILAPLTPAADLEQFLRRPGWRSITAVTQRQIHFLEEDIVSRPGPRVAQGLWAIAAALHPDRFLDSPPLPSAAKSEPLLDAGE